MLSSQKIVNFLKENKSYIKEHFYCSEIGLFGSFAREEQNNESDIDILVTFDPSTPDIYNAEIQLKEFIKNKFNREVDICSKKWIKPVFKSLVLKDTIYA